MRPAPAFRIQVPMFGCSQPEDCSLCCVACASPLVEQMSTEMKERSQTKTCKRCKSSFATQSNSSSACRFHPAYFVCRRHDDQKRYYELGPDDPPYAAKFWDCCGSEDPGARGCKTSFHVSYDDDAERACQPVTSKQSLRTVQ